MPKNNIYETSGKWVEIADEQVRNVWACDNEDCKAFGHEAHLTPDFYNNNGTPVCDECDCDMTYFRTEVKI